MRRSSYPNLRESDWQWLQTIAEDIKWQQHVAKDPTKYHRPYPNEWHPCSGTSYKIHRLYKLGLVEAGEMGIKLSKYGRRVLKLWRGDP